MITPCFYFLICILASDLANINTFEGKYIGILTKYLVYLPCTASDSTAASFTSAGPCPGSFPGDPVSAIQESLGFFATSFDRPWRPFS